jgi:diguanylate cyclase (GGDEF)-like protein
MSAPPILVLASSLDNARMIAQGDMEGDPPLLFMTWEDFESSRQGTGALSAVVWDGDDEVRSHKGLVEIVRRAFPHAPLIMFTKQADPPGPRREPDPAVDLHLTAPLSAENLRAVIAREMRLRTLSRRHRHALGQIREQADKLNLLVETAKAANSLLEPRLVMQVLMSRVRELIRAETWSLHLLVERSGGTSFDVWQGDRSGSLKSYREDGGGGIAGWVVRNRRPALVADAAVDPRCSSSHGNAVPEHVSVLCVPLTSRGRIIGAVELVENAILFKKLEELSVTDDLTRLYNSRYLNTSLGREIKRARRYRQSVSVMFLDLDGFKRINDSHGHLAGSRALVEVGQLLKERVRESDIVSRYGGDEFTIILAQTAPEEAVLLADRLRRALEEHVFLTILGLSVKITASFGISSFPEHGGSREELIQQADQAMYRVKERGKNGVELAPSRAGSVATKA